MFHSHKTTNKQQQNTNKQHNNKNVKKSKAQSSLTVNINCVSAHDHQVMDQTVDLALWDTAGQEDYDRLRPLSYPDTDVLIMCYTVDNRDSFQNITERWVPEVNHFCPSVPVILVACKKDLRFDPATHNRLAEFKQKPVSREEGQALANRIDAHAFYECSAKLGEGVQEVFMMAARFALLKRKIVHRHRMCRLL